MAQCGDFGKEYSEEFKKTNPENAGWLVWDRDPDIWGDMKNRKIRLDTYASYGTIKEAFATFFMFYTLSRVDDRYDKSLLTKDETGYFDRMFDGFSKNPEGYIKTLIAENPGPAYTLDMFDNKHDIRAQAPEHYIKSISNDRSARNVPLRQIVESINI